MPLIKSKSKSAFGKNVEAEEHAGKKPSEALAIAFSVKRKAKKKMAEGGTVKDNDKDSPPSAKTEARPMPQRMDDSGKASKNDSWTDRSTVAQAQSNPKPKLMPINDTKMTDSSVIHAHRIDALGQRLDAMEKHLQSSAGVNEGPQIQPPKADDEEGADRQGPTVPALKMKKMADGGSVKREMGAGPENDNVEHPAGLESDNDQMRPPSAEYMSGYMAGRMAAGGTVESGSPDMNMADGGMAHEMDDIDVDEMDDEKHSSIAAAIMSKRHKMAEGGTVDLSTNADEEPNNEDQMSFEALKKENYSESEGLDDLGDQPTDSNEKGDEREADEENDKDKSIVSKIRAKKRKTA